MRTASAAEGRLLNLHGYLPRSRANGPGVRAVVWVQGCTLGCPGCFNPETHARTPGERISAAALARRILAEPAALEGLTLSGGEPLQQARAVLELLEIVRAASDLGVVLFSGYELEEIRARPLGTEVLRHVDALIAGRYREEARVARGLRGSANKTIHLLTDRYRLEEVETTPRAEVVLRAGGEVVLTGIAPLRGREKVQP